MTMPKAAMDEQRSTVAGKDDVRFARQMLNVHAKPQAEVVQRTPQCQFR